MTDRDRWIVYPLLLLALGSSMKDRLLPQETVVCGRLVTGSVEIQDARGNPRIRMNTREEFLDVEKTRTISRPEITLMAPNSQIQCLLSTAGIRAADVQANRLQILDERDRPRVALLTKPTPNDQLKVLKPEEQAALRLSGASQGAIALLDENGNDRVVLETLPVVLPPAQDATKQAAESEAADAEEAPPEDKPRQAKPQPLVTSQGLLKIFNANNEQRVTIHEQVIAGQVQAVQVQARSVEAFEGKIRGDLAARRLLIFSAADQLGILLTSLWKGEEKTSEGSGFISLLGKNRKELMRLGSDPQQEFSEGVIAVRSLDGKPRVGIYGSSHGGGLTTYHDNRDLTVSLGHQAGLSGLLSQSAGTPLPQQSLFLGGAPLESLPPRPEPPARQDAAVLREPDDGGQTEETPTSTSADAAGKESTADHPSPPAGPGDSEEGDADPDSGDAENGNADDTEPGHDVTEENGADSQGAE
ncbi:MAG: hypothetical protein DWQ42_03625 [Planctomycetota bacterium]|nr:MAG: hypothetical protein DWQ42_03625 [Planctomycetota bacterium]REK46795.1 MAG: hypothetical protein DWQ46_05770 [Planctomycetota bacterium]